MDTDNLNYYINKLDSETNITLTEIEQINIFNYLKDLKFYMSAGSISEVLDLKANYKTLKFFSRFTK